MGGGGCTEFGAARKKAPTPPAPSPDAACPHPIPRPLPRRGEGEKTRGINGVPAVVVEGKWLISGGQPAGVFEEALRGMANT